MHNQAGQRRSVFKGAVRGAIDCKGNVERVGMSVRGVTIQRLLTKSFRQFKDRPCLRWEGGVASYAETGDRVRNLAAWLSDSASGPRHVAILLPNSRAYVETILACASGGVVRVPLSTRDPLPIIEQKLASSESGVLVTTQGYAEDLRSWIEENHTKTLIVDATSHSVGASFEGIASRPPVSEARSSREHERFRLSFTGGTTGHPKAVVQTHVQERAMIRNLLLEVVPSDPGSCFVASTPLSHAAGAFVIPAAVRGGSIAWTGRFDPERLADDSWLGSRPPTSLSTFVVPTALGDLADAAGRGHPLSTVVYGGAPCPDPILDFAMDRIGHLTQVYGQAEAPMTICVATPDDHASGRVSQGWVGRPFTFVDVSVEEGRSRDVGELIVFGDHVMSGYWREPEATSERFTENRGLRTGDIAQLEDDGAVRIVGRARELIITGGFNVYPADVERRLSGVADVANVVVFAVPHPRWGEAVVVAVESDLSRDEAVSRIRRRASEELADYERPKAIFVVDKVPLTPVGKVSKQQLSERFEGHFNDVSESSP